METLLKISEAARMLTVSEPTLRIWVFKRKIGTVRVGRSVRIPKAEVDRFLTQNVTAPQEFLRPAAR